MTSASISLTESLTAPIAAREELFLIAGEASGDLLGSLLVKSLKRELPKLPLVGVGGPKMKEAGLLPIGSYYDQLQIIGIWEIIKNLPSLLGNINAVTDEILRRQPKGVVFIDFSGFNLRVAKKLRQKGYQGKLFQFISPTVWAWRKERIPFIGKTIDRLFSIYPFEKDVYASTPLQVDYIGHPLQEILQQINYDPQFEEKFGIKEDQPLIAVFPGSRPSELKRNLPLIVPILEAFLKRNPDYQVAFSIQKGAYGTLVKNYIGKKFPFIQIPPSHTYELMQRAKVALAKSGTVTLELAWHQVPTAVIYALSPVDRFLAKWWFHLDLPYYCIVNILADKSVFPEFIRDGAPPQKVAAALEALVTVDAPLVKKECESVWNALTPPGYLPATQLAARKIRESFFNL